MPTLSENFRPHNYRGEIEIVIRDRNGRVVNVHREHNLVKIFAKEMLAHRLPYSKVWDPNAGTGSGGWVDNSIDPLEEFAAKYILLGASFDQNTGQPLDTQDPRYYVEDEATNSYMPKRPNVGADNEGDLINPIPISEPYRPLKRIERATFIPSYQPADTPLLNETVRAVNNVLVLETTLKLNEYNGFNTSSTDFFTITEVALAGGKALDGVGNCECPPKVIFREGINGANDVPIPCVANSSAVITIDSGVSDPDTVKEGDQIQIIDIGGTADTTGASGDPSGQVQPYYLVTSKSPGGRDITLDRTPTSNGVALNGPIGIYRNSLRLFSQRILSVPFKKSSDYEIDIRWLIYFN